MIEHAKKLGVPYTNWAVLALVKHLNDETGVPEPPPARAPLPSPVDELNAYLRGERLLLPCGREGLSCPGTERIEFVGGLGFCPECRIRVQ